MFVQDMWACLMHCISLHTRGRILGRNRDKSVTSFPPCYSQSPLLSDFTPTPRPPSKSGLNWCVMSTLYTETFSLRTPKIMPINLNEIVRSWIRLLYSYSTCVCVCEQFTVTDEYMVQIQYTNIQYNVFELAHFYSKTIFTAIRVFCGHFRIKIAALGPLEKVTKSWAS